MIALISPAKTLDYSDCELKTNSHPRLLPESQQLIDNLRKKSTNNLQKLMKVSENIATLNHKRYQDFQTPFTSSNAKQAILAFRGDVYTGLAVNNFEEKDFQFAQKHLRILSGLYGLLKPLDLMQAYRLEMGTRLENKKGKNLYQFWGDKITDLLEKDLKEQGDDIILNLASNEYFKAINKKKVTGKLYNINFKENRNGVFKVISFSAKKARGMMCQYIIKNQLTKPEQVKKFDLDNYTFNQELSSEFEYIFTK